MARATIADVAKLAGVSQATVSRALRGIDKVTPATRRKVLDAADRLNFTLLKSASALASGKTMRIILLSSGKLNEWFNSNVLQGAYEVLTPEGYDVSPASIIGKDEADHYSPNFPRTATPTRSSSRPSNSMRPCVNGSRPSTCPPSA